MFTKTKLTLLFLATLTAVVCAEENRKPLDALFPSPILVPRENDKSTDNTSDEINDWGEDPYTCGDYSRATGLGNVKKYFNRTVNPKILDRDPIQFIQADVSCAFEPDRKIFDNDSIRNNNIKDMVWDVNEGNPEQQLENDFSLLNGTKDSFAQVGESEDDYENARIKIPKNIHIRVYAIDNHLEFKYRSNPHGLIRPVFDILPAVQFNNQSHTNTTLLRFVWNRTRTRDKFQSIFKIFDASDDPYKDRRTNATLEMWIPNWILEQSVIIGPRYDYSLGIEIGGTVNNGSGSGGGGNNATKPIKNGIRTVNDVDPKLLLTKGPPRRLAVVNNGIATNVTLVINTESENPELDLHTELKFVDSSLNGEVRIKTDQNVSGTIQLDGSNVRAAVVQPIRDFMKTNRIIDEDGGDGIQLKVNGFQQVVTVSGNYNDIVVEGTSIALYTTRGCSEKDGVTISTKEAVCVPLKADVHRSLLINKTLVSGEIGETPMFQDLGDSLELGLDAIGLGNISVYAKVGRLKPLPLFVFLPGSCMVTTKTFEYNCNPLSSGTMGTNFVGMISSISVATIMAMIAY